jgi:cation diffusion facilitator family transporter
VDSAPRLALTGAFINLVLTVIKLIGGYIGDSQALVADGIESGGDVLSSTLVFFGLRYAAKPADKNHPYGHGRAEPLITIVVVLMLAIAAVVIALQSIHHIRSPHNIPAPYTLCILGGVILVKEIMFRIMVRRGRIMHSTALIAEAWHHRSDAITSIAAFIGVSLALFMGKGYEASDDWASLFVSGVILYNGYRLFRPALGEMMDEHLHEDLVEQIRRLAMDVEGIRGTEKCLIRKTGMRYHIDLHALMDPDLNVRTAHDISHKLKAHLLEKLPHVADVLIHIEPA